jgi:hypothetical protein
MYDKKYKELIIMNLWDENGNIVENDDLDTQDMALVIEALILDTLSSEEIDQILLLLESPKDI